MRMRTGEEILRDFNRRSIGQGNIQREILCPSEVGGREKGVRKNM
jgi:hypothetical protein